MAIFQSGPFNIEQGNTASFVVEFFDTTGATTVPSSASMTMAYTNTSGSSQTDNVALTVVNSFFLGTWSSTSAALGIAVGTATTAFSSIQVSLVQLRVMQRRAST